MMKRIQSMRLKLFLSLFISGLFIMAGSQAGAVAPGAKGSYKNTITAARTTLWNAIANGHGTGATVAVSDNGRIVYSEGIGVAERSENRRVDRKTRFNIASTSKVFAATAILLLVDEGKVGLDNSVARYVPEFTMKDPRYRKITVRMLFNHSSGLPGSSDFSGYAGEYPVHRLLLERMKEAYLKHDPGAMSIYCNDGFTLAEMIVEKVSGRKYVEFLAQRIFKPLGMKHTGPTVGEAKVTNVAEYYDPKTGKKYPREVISLYGAGGLSSTAEDLCRFGESFSQKGKRILSSASLREILRTQPTHFSDKLNDRQMMSEFGWDYSSLSGYREKGIQVLGKGGNSNFYSTNLQIVPEKGIAVAVSISGQYSGEMLSRPILDALMADKKIMKAQAKAAKKPAEPQAIPSDYLPYAGIYAGDSGVVKFEFEKDLKKVTLVPLTKNAKARPLTFTYLDGYFRNVERNMDFYFKTVEGRRYFVSHASPPFGYDMLMYQKLREIKDPPALSLDVNGKIWAIRNAAPHASAVPDLFLVTSSVYKELPGYVDALGIKRIESARYAGIAATAFRDQSALFLFDRNGETWARISINLYSPAERVQKAADGANRVTIGKEGYNEWLKMDKGALLSVQRPPKGRVIVLTPETVLFDSVVDSGEIYAPEGSYVFCAGAAGEIFTVTAR